MKEMINFFKLSEREAKEVTGAGRYCTCACAYANCNGSNTDDNYEANYTGGGRGLSSPDTQVRC